MQSRSQTSGQDDAKLKCGASLVYNSIRPTKKNSSTTWLCTSPWTQTSRRSDTWVQLRKRGKECITNSKRVTPAYCQAGTYLLPSLLVFGSDYAWNSWETLVCIMGFNIFIRRHRKADPLLGVFSANSKISSPRQTTASNSYRLVPRTTGANTVQQNCWKVSGFASSKKG